MKVVRIIARLNVGGPARHVVWLSAGLAGAGFETVLVAGVVPPGEDDMGYFAAERGVTPHIIPHMSREISLKDALTIWKLYRLLLRERPAIVHTHTAKAGTVGRIAGFLYRWLTVSTLIGRPRPCRFVHTYHGHIFHSYYGPLKTRLFLLIEKTLARFATTRIVVISPQQFREIHEEFGVGRARQFRIVPLGLDLGIFNGWEGRRERLRAELGVDDRAILVGIVGRLTEVKNHSLFLETAARFKEMYGAQQDSRRVRFVIIGDGSLRGKLAAQARDLGLNDEIIFTGTRKDPENFYPALDIVALTSLNEGTPLTLIEAMANARAVISTKVGGVVDLLGSAAVGMRGADSPEQDKEEPGGFSVREHGIIVRPNDAEAFAEGLSHLVANETLRRAMGERGHSFVAKNYSKERLLEDVTNLYRELAPEKSKEPVISKARLKSKENLPSDSRLQTSDSRLNKGDI
ncbi:MAG TPA: glycosyltransferase [Pyrinomonadaceae bacterium]|nr:glycosyltransferase [Pyrinomonadaceae bacterium]